MNMKRTSLKRKTPMARTPMRRRSKSTSYSRRPRDTDRMLWIKTLPCAARLMGPCEGVVEADHAGRRGLGMKASDDTCIPLCSYHHSSRDHFSGVFSTWDKERMRAWLLSEIGAAQALYQERGGGTS